ncbi:MAG: carboxymuconolactone decarboxylase family protein [bacterium]
MKIFTEVYPNFKKSRSAYDLRKFNLSGKRNCKLIYKNNYKKLIENMSLYSPDLKVWILTEGYGKVMDRKGLSLIDREYVNVTILCVNYYPEQLHSHLKGCLNLGATKIEIETLIHSIRRFMKPTNMNNTIKLLKRIEALKN